MELTHKSLVEIAYKWELNNASCGVAFKELYTIVAEHPDVIEFGSWGHSVSVLLEHSHTISQKRCKQLRLPEMIYDGENIMIACRSCHAKVESLNLKTMQELLNFQDMICYIRENDLQTYNKIIVGR